MNDGPGKETLPRALRVIVVDNYDSFTWNLVELLERLGARCDVVEHDAATAVELGARPAHGFVVSPGPSSPARSGASLALFERALAGLEPRPILGVCLGHQALAAAAGTRVARAARPVHGKTSRIHHDGRGIFARSPLPFLAARYNSLVVEEASLAAELEVSARSDEGEIMALRHRTRPLETVQFHPESHLTEAGDRLISSWLATLEPPAVRRAAKV
ncbi:MAG: aminodeoxychorismate/anthranilate synthase component II [Polyangiaceae bacterium]